MDEPSPDPKLQLLQRVPLFAGLAAEQLSTIAAICEEREVAAGTILTHEGRHEGYFFIIVFGTVRIERGGETLNTLRDGDFLGEISLLDGGPRTATALAETDSQLLVMSFQRFQQLLGESEEVRAAVLQEVGNRLRQLDADPNY